MSIAETEPATAARISIHPCQVVHLVLTLNFGGLEKVVYDLVRCSDRRNSSVRVICLAEIGALGATFRDAGVPIETLEVHEKGPLQGVLATARRLRELRPHVLHTHNGAPHLVGALAARLAGVPVVVHTRHGQHRFHGWKANAINRLATWLTHRIVAVSEDAAQVARASDKVSEKKLVIIRNGVDLERFPARDFAPRGGACRAIHVARLDNPIKDQSTLLRAARIVADELPDFVLDIVGDGPSRGELEALCDALRLRPYVNFLGLRDDVQRLLMESHLFVLSSLTEGLSISILEAMAAGLPVVATDVGGNPEVVANGTTGLLTPVRSPEALAAAMLELLRDPARAVQMGAAGRRRVEEHFDLRQVAREYEQIYYHLLGA